MIRNVSRKEFAARAGISITAFHELYKDGCIPKGRSIGRNLFWLESVVEAWIIRAFEHPMPLPPLSLELEIEVEEAVKKLKERESLLVE